jgi:hypothetical protein
MDCKHCLPELKKNLWMSMQDTPKEVREHLEQCPLCYSEFQWMIRNREAFSEIEQIQIPINLHRTIMQALEPEMISVKEKSWKKWFEFLQWKPAFSFAAASILIVTIATIRLTQQKPVQTMELLQPGEPPTAMRSLTKEEEAAVKDSMSMMTTPVIGSTTNGFEEVILEITPDEFNIWEAFFIEKEFPYQRIESENEVQIIIEGTGTEIVELRKELIKPLDQATTVFMHEFLLQSDSKAETSEKTENVVLQSEQSYRVTFQKKLK